MNENLNDIARTFGFEPEDVKEGDDRRWWNADQTTGIVEDREGDLDADGNRVVVLTYRVIDGDGVPAYRNQSFDDLRSALYATRGA